MNIFKLSSFAFITSMLCMGTIAGNNVYKWTDKNGLVHYSQNAPEGVKVEIISTKTPYEEAEELESESEENTEQTTDTNNDVSDSGSGEEGEDSPKQEGPVAKKDKATCEQALKDIASLQKPIVRMEGKVMTIEEKNEQLKILNEIKTVHCP